MKKTLLMAAIILFSPLCLLAQENSSPSYFVTERDGLEYYVAGDKEFGPYEKIYQGVNTGQEAWGFAYFPEGECSYCSGDNLHYNVNGKVYGPYPTYLYLSPSYFGLYLSDTHFAFAFRKAPNNEIYYMYDGQEYGPCASYDYNMYMSNGNSGFLCSLPGVDEKDIFYMNGEVYEDINIVASKISKNNWAYYNYEDGKVMLHINGDEFGPFDQIRDLAVSDDTWAAALEKDGKYYVLSNGRGMYELPLSREQAEGYDDGIFYDRERFKETQCDAGIWGCNRYGEDKLVLEGDCWSLRYQKDGGYVDFNCGGVAEAGGFRARDYAMYNRLKGRIIIKVEDLGRAYYIYPLSREVYYLGRPDDAFTVMRELGKGISNTDLARIPTADSLTGTGDMEFAQKQHGKILLQVEENGEAWYVNPEDSKRYYLGRPDDAFRVMRELGLGISNADFNLLAL